MKKFNELTKAQKRVVLAKDALKWLNTGMLVAETGTVWSGAVKHFTEDPQIKPALQKALKEKTLRCDVCARGALLVSTVARCNKFTKDDYSSSTGMYNPDSPVDRRLGEFFSDKQLALMEGAFEGCISDNIDSDFYDEFYDACDDFYRKYSSDHDRLKAILQNVIKNRGTFKL